MPDALLVRIQGARLALPLSGEQTIAELGPVAPLPNGEPLLLGLATVQGRAVPLVNLAPLLPGASDPSGLDDRLMVLTDLDGDRVALLVSEVLGVSALPEAPASAALLIDLPGGPLLNPSALLLELRDSLER
ncbi:chemotaxis protein CheW [Deinococcus depolymerans]|uniref:CheW-like domain-containing protein n=1 Tax=Deinococcus depolymerans TaxID=392408 RepID=A0ABP3LXZ1_9DEIO